MYSHDICLICFHLSVFIAVIRNTMRISNNINCSNVLLILIVALRSHHSLYR